jgi:hypothetical protein
MDNGLTLSLGLRYDLEVIPINERYNPFFEDTGDYPVDKNNFAPRVGVIWNPDGKGQTVFRGGWGLFYDKTILGTIDDFDQARKYSESFTGTFPQNAADPGPASGRFPTDPTLSNGIYDHLTPEVLAYINSIYPKGSTLRNTGTVVYDDPDRKVPLFKQMSVGFSRQLFAGVSVNADYVRMRGTEQFLSPNLNLGTRATTARSGPVTFTDPFSADEPGTGRSAVRRHRSAAPDDEWVQQLRRTRHFDGEKVLAWLEPSRRLFDRLLAWGHGWPGRHAAIPSGR